MRPPAIPVAASEARLARWFGHAGHQPGPPGLPREQAAALAGVTGAVPWAQAWTTAHGGLDGRHWLWLEPVRMQAGMHSVSMLPPAQALDRDQLDALRTRLDPLFSEADIRLEAAAGRLLAGFRTPLQAACSAPESAYGSELREHLPSGPDAARLRRLMTECQMVLHPHPHDDQEPLANALWPWGNGPLPATPLAPGAWLCSDDALVCALAQALGAFLPAPLEAGARLATGLPSGTRLVVCAEAGQSWLPALLETAESAVRHGRLESIELLCWTRRDGSGQPRAARLGRWKLLRAWRRPASPWNPDHESV